MMNVFGCGFGAYGFTMNYAKAATAFNKGPHDGGNASANMTYLPRVSVIRGNAESYLDAHNKIQNQMDAYFNLTRSYLNTQTYLRGQLYEY